jgi:hypothetical protein
MAEIDECKRSDDFMFFTAIGACTVFTQGVLIHYLVPKLGDRGCIYLGTITNVLVHVIMAVLDQGWIYCLIPLMSLAYIAPSRIINNINKQ